MAGLISITNLSFKLASREAHRATDARQLRVGKRFVVSDTGLLPQGRHSCRI